MAQQAARALLWMEAAVLTGIFLLLYVAFDSVRNAALVMINLPLALSIGDSGSEIQAPMALVILFGLLSSTVLNMVVLPALYRRFGSAAQGQIPD